jgi:hypothetical protein
VPVSNTTTTLSDTSVQVGSLRLLRVLPDGTVRLVGDLLNGSIYSSVSMAGGPDADDIRLLFEGRGAGTGLMWWRYDAQAPIDPITFASRADYQGPAAALAFGADTVAFLQSASTGGYAIARIGPDGTLVGPIRKVAAMPYGSMGGPQMVRRGPELVVGFMGGIDNLLYLARIVP